MILTNYYKTALRNLWKNKGFSAINILGLAAGLAVWLLIVLYVADELNYDTYNVKANRIYRLESNLKFNGTQFHSSSSGSSTVSPKEDGAVHYTNVVFDITTSSLLRNEAYTEVPN